MTAIVRAKALTTAVLLSATLIGCAQSYARPTSSYKPLQGPFYRFLVSKSTAADADAPRAAVTVTAPPDATPSPPVPSRPRPPQTARSETTPIASGTSITGKASWYCKVGVSVCHHAYPPGSMVAAACGKLRAAIGSDWRGQTVVVRSSGGRQVTVRLVDYCASTDKLIDLYWRPMQLLGGTGVLRVTVNW